MIKSLNWDDNQFEIFFSEYKPWKTRPFNVSIFNFGAYYKY
jgi:hypothetical protein